MYVTGPRSIIHHTLKVKVIQQSSQVWWYMPAISKLEANLSYVRHCLNFFLFLIFLIFYFLCLHSKWFPLSWFSPPHKSHKPSSLHVSPDQPPPTSLSWQSSTMLHQAFPGPGPSPSFFLGIIWYVNCVLGIQSFWANIHLSVTAFPMYSGFAGYCFIESFQNQGPLLLSSCTSFDV